MRHFQINRGVGNLFADGRQIKILLADVIVGREIKHLDSRRGQGAQINPQRIMRRQHGGHPHAQPAVSAGFGSAIQQAADLRDKLRYDLHPLWPGGFFQTEQAEVAEEIQFQTEKGAITTRIFLTETDSEKKE